MPLARTLKSSLFTAPVVHPASEEYFPQTALRHGDYVAKLGLFPSSPGLIELKEQEFDPQTPDALRDAMNGYYKSKPA